MSLVNMPGEMIGTRRPLSASLAELQVLEFSLLLIFFRKAPFFSLLLLLPASFIFPSCLSKGLHLELIL